MAAKEASRTCDEYLNQYLESEKYYEISLSDVVGMESYQRLCTNGNECDKEDLFKFLFVLGLDTSRNIEEQYNTHRNKSNKVVTCPRWVGYQRTDKEWLDFKKG